MFFNFLFGQLRNVWKYINEPSPKQKYQLSNLATIQREAIFQDLCSPTTAWFIVYARF